MWVHHLGGVLLHRVRVIGDRQAALAMSRSVWKNVNLKNLEEFILPTRGRADIILHKQENHLIDRIYLRKH